MTFGHLEAQRYPYAVVIPQVCRNYSDAGVYSISLLKQFGQGSYELHYAVNIMDSSAFVWMYIGFIQRSY